MAKRKKRRPREKTATVDYVDAEGNRLLLRESLSRGTIRKIGEGPATAAATQEDAWRRRSELLSSGSRSDGRSPACPSTTRRCCWGATGWRTRRPSSGCADDRPPPRALHPGARAPRLSDAGAAQPPSSLAFWAANSSSVRIPWLFSSPAP